jgi:hypothetical protein
MNEWSYTQMLMRKTGTLLAKGTLLSNTIRTQPSVRSVLRLKE